MRARNDLSERIAFQYRKQAESPPAFLKQIAWMLAAKPFAPHPAFTNGHAQTLAAYYWPRPFLRRAHRQDEARLFEVEPGVRLLAHCRWQKDRRSHPTMLLAHGLEGASTSVYMLGTAEKAYRAGFNVVRLNFRTCGRTEHLTPTLYHAGMTGDLRAILCELIEKDQLAHILMVGFSMGGNMSLMYAGAEADRVSWAAHVEEFRRVRLSTISLFANMPSEAWMRSGIASDKPFTVRALAYIIAGHSAHHRDGRVEPLHEDEAAPRRR